MIGTEIQSIKQFLLILTLAIVVDEQMQGAIFAKVSNYFHLGLLFPRLEKNHQEYGRL